MNLENVKLKIDNYFNEVPADELYEKLTKDYGMSGYDLDNEQSEQMLNVPLSAEIA